jgi:hypothetical protein
MSGHMSAIGWLGTTGILFILSRNLTATKNVYREN